VESKNVDPIEVESRIVVSRVWGVKGSGKDGNYLANKYKVIDKKIKFWCFIVQ
jgi:hypothetical protein